MSFLYLTRTVRMPVRAVGCTLLDREQREIATAPDTFTATAMADLINMAEPIALAREAKHEAEQTSLSNALLKSRASR